MSEAVAVLVLLLLMPLSALAADDGPVVQLGWDWRLPAGTEPVPYSGFVTWGRKRFDPSVTVRGVHVRWKQLNPAPGVYDWQPLLGAIEENSAAGMRTGIHLMGSERQGIPDWVIEQSGAPVIDVPVLQENQPWRLQIVPPWVPEVDAAFHRFLKAFGETGIPQSDDVVYGYIHGISPSRGEELWLRKVDIEMLEEASGLTPEVLADWLRRRIDGMTAAFEGAEHKLAWMSGGPVGQDAAYKEATKDVWRYAFEQGAGIRGGGIDFMHHIFSAPAWSSRLDAEGHCLVDDEHPTIAEGRFRGDENEEYGKYWEWRFGPHDKYDYRHRISSLRALQMRQNFLTVSPATLELNPDLNRYVLLSMGHRREDSPDAWAYLRECRMGWLRGRSVLNLERWLVQRDVDGSRSVAAERTDRHPLGRDVQGVHYDHDARRTDLAAGQDGLAFQLDERFWPGPAPAEVKVTFTDRAACRWRRVTVNAAGEQVASGPVTNSGDGLRKTATFQVADLTASRAMPGEMDFRIVTEGPGDLTVTVVRVIKTGP